MPAFQIDLMMPNSKISCPKLQSVKEMLDGEWFIECDYTNIKQDKNSSKIHSLKICRKNVDGMFLVRGELRLQTSNSTSCWPKWQGGTKTVWEKTISEVFFLESLSLIDTYIDTSGADDVSLNGCVKISNFFDKLATELQSFKHLSNDMEKLLDPYASCSADVTLKCEGASIPAHKLILSARSPVIAAMCAHPIKKGDKNEVDIDDIEISNLKIMVNYMYTGKARDLTTSSAADLLLAADKYQLQGLKVVCCNFLKENLSTQNVLRILVLGDVHAEELKSSATDYLCNQCANFSVLEETEEWNVLRKERPALVMDVLTCMAKSRDKKIMALQK